MGEPFGIPVTVLGGYLGAGKTTLLNRLLRESGRRVAVLINDFGEIGIDADLVESRDGDTLNLVNGCICCSIAGGFHDAMVGLRDRAEPPEWVIVEASGVSDPSAVAQYAHLDGFRLDAVVVVADAEEVRTRAADRYVGRQVREQLGAADLLVMNKVDLVDDATRADVLDWLVSTAGVTDAVVVETSHAAVPIDLLVPGVNARTRRHADGPAGHGHRLDGYATWSVDVDSAIDATAFDSFVAALPPAVLRAKGIVTFADDLDAHQEFHLVGRRTTLRRHEADAAASPSTRLVLIARTDADNAAADTAAIETALAELRRDLAGHAENGDPL